MGNEVKVDHARSAHSRASWGSTCSGASGPKRTSSSTTATARSRTSCGARGRLNGARWNAAAFYALPPAMRENRAVPARPRPSSTASRTSRSSRPRRSRASSRAKIPPKVELTELRVFSGTKPVEVAPDRDPEAAVREGRTQAKAPPRHARSALGSTADQARASRNRPTALYEDVLDVLGPPSSVDQFDHLRSCFLRAGSATR